MEKKIQKKYIYEGFGFPIHLLDVPMIKSRGQWTADIDYNKLQKAVALALATKPICLSGSEIQFIRKYFRMTLEAFGKEFGVSHVAVIDWEAEKENQSKINAATEKCIRMFILDELINKDKQFREAYHQVELKSLAKQQKARNLLGRARKPFEFDMKNYQIA